MPVILPDGSRRSFDDLLSHSEDVARDGELLDMLLVICADLKQFFKETAPPMKEVLELFGKYRINAFNVSDDVDEIVAMGLYLEASVFDHSCDPNATVSFTGKTLSVRSIVNNPGLSFEDVRISYADLMCDTETRRASLRQTYYFECR